MIYTLKNKIFLLNSSRKVGESQKASKLLEMPKETIKKFGETYKSSFLGYRD